MRAYLKLFLLIIFTKFCSINFLVAQKYIATLAGPNEAPPNASAGTGLATITINSISMRVQCTFSGLTGNTTATHLHAATMQPFSGTASVATVTPTFTGFPSGVNTGIYDQTFDMSLATSFNPSYVTAHGGSISQAWADLQTAIVDGKSYFNIHSNTFPGGEIRGFLIPSICTTTKTGIWNDPTIWTCNIVPTGLDMVTISPSHIITIPVNYAAYAKNIEINGILKKEIGASLTLKQ